MEKICRLANLATSDTSYNTDALTLTQAFTEMARVESGRSLANVVGKTAEQAFPGDIGRVASAHHVEAWRPRQRIMPFADELVYLRITLAPQFNELGDVVRKITACRLCCET